MRKPPSRVRIAISPGGTFERNNLGWRSGDHQDANPTTLDAADILPNARQAVASLFITASTRSPAVTAHDPTEIMFSGDSVLGGTRGFGLSGSPVRACVIARKVDRRRMTGL